MWTVNRRICFSFWCGSSFIFSKPVCAGWWDYNSYGSYWTVSAELVINNPENTYCICMVLKDFLAVDSKRKFNLGSLKKENTSYIQLRTGDWHVRFLIKTEAIELSIDKKHTMVRAEQGPSAFRSAWTRRGYRYEKLHVLPSLFQFMFQSLSTMQSDSSPAHNTHIHTHRAHGVFGALFLLKHEVHWRTHTVYGPCN